MTKCYRRQLADPVLIAPVVVAVVLAPVSMVHTGTGFFCFSWLLFILVIQLPALWTYSVIITISMSPLSRPRVSYALLIHMHMNRSNFEQMLT